MDAFQRQQVLDDFKRRRTRELIAVVPCVASIYVIVQIFDDPEFQVSGVRGGPLLFSALAVLAAVLIHHIVNWRCPVCGNVFLTGIGVTHCKKCGTLFTEPKGLPGGDPVAAQQERVELAVKADVGEYRGKYAMLLLRGLVIVLIGCLMFFFLADDPNALKPDSVLIQKFGVEGAHLLLKAFSGAVLLAGIAMVAWALQRIRVGSRRHEEEVRRRFQGS